MHNYLPSMLHFDDILWNFCTSYHTPICVDVSSVKKSHGLLRWRAAHQSTYYITVKGPFANSPDECVVFISVTRWYHTNLTSTLISHSQSVSQCCMVLTPWSCKGRGRWLPGQSGSHLRRPGGDAPVGSSCCVNLLYFMGYWSKHM